MELQYARDSTLVAHFPTDVQNALTDALAIYKIFGLEVNTDKTKVLCCLPRDVSERFTTLFHFGNSALNIVRDFKL